MSNIDLSQGISREKIREHNLEWTVRYCIEKFEKDKKKFILININENFYQDFKNRLINHLNGSGNELIFITFYGKLNLGLIESLYGKKRVIIYDKSRKTKLFDLEKKKRRNYTSIDIDYFLNSNSFYYN